MNVKAGYERNLFSQTRWKFLPSYSLRDWRNITSYNSLLAATETPRERVEWAEESGKLITFQFLEVLPSSSNTWRLGLYSDLNHIWSNLLSLKECARDESELVAALQVGRNLHVALPVQLPKHRSKVSCAKVFRGEFDFFELFAGSLLLNGVEPAVSELKLYREKRAPLLLDLVEIGWSRKCRWRASCRRWLSLRRDSRTASGSWAGVVDLGVLVDRENRDFRGVLLVLIAALPESCKCEAKVLDLFAELALDLLVGEALPVEDEREPSLSK